MAQRGIPKSVSKKGLTVFPLRFSRLFMVWRVNDKLHLHGTIRSQRADHPVHGRTNEDQRYTKARIYNWRVPQCAEVYSLLCQFLWDYSPDESVALIYFFKTAHFFNPELSFRLNISAFTWNKFRIIYDNICCHICQSVRSAREGVPKKSCSFGFCPNEVGVGGGGLPKFFGTF